MIIRVQSSAGTKRVEVSETDTVSKLYKLCGDVFKLGSSVDWSLSKTRNADGVLSRQTRKLIKTAALKHGDMIFLINQPQSASKPNKSEVMEIDTPMLQSMSRSLNSLLLQEDEVDKELDTMDGKIVRGRNNFCHHPEEGKCIHCVPLEPYDSEYLSHCDPPVKFMSFHAYIRKLQGGYNKGKFVSLDNLDCRVRRDCPNHPPWPEGICTKCQPKPVTLDVQTYRHVDYVQFENGQLMETFLDYWRETGKQRIGLLIGRYARIDSAGAQALPLAIKTVVTAIYEPPQEGTNRTVKLTVPLDQLVDRSVQSVLDGLGLKVVGWIFTDLTADTKGGGTVKHYRGTADTFFVSAQECITAACLQNLHPNITHHATEGHFGSKFVTVVVTGSKKGEIHFEGYQMSNVAMALQSANILVPTYDAPELGYIRKTTKEQFVPDVFYSSKDKYGNVVTRIGRPLPVEFLLVDMPAAFPIEPVFTFAEIPSTLDAASRFPVANREDLGQKQDFNAFARFVTAIMRTCNFDYQLNLLSNFHVLTWLSSDSSLPLAASEDPNDGMPGLLKAIKQDIDSGLSDGPCVTAWAASSTHWATLQTIISVHTGEGSPAVTSAPSIRPPTFRDVLVGEPTTLPGRNNPADPAVEGSAKSDVWACKHCTFDNPGTNAECEMCSLPRSH